MTASQRKGAYYSYNSQRMYLLPPGERDDDWYQWAAEVNFERGFYFYLDDEDTPITPEPFIEGQVEPYFTIETGRHGTWFEVFEDTRDEVRTFRSLLGAKGYAQYLQAECGFGEAQVRVVRHAWKREVMR